MTVRCPTDVRKFLEFLIFSSAYRKKSGLPGNDYMWDAIERICLRTSYLDTRVYNGGLMRTSARGPGVSTCPLPASRPAMPESPDWIWVVASMPADKLRVCMWGVGVFVSEY
jgi:hypothetical protein